MTALLVLLAWLALAVVCAAVFAFGVRVGERRRDDEWLETVRQLDGGLRAVSSPRQARREVVS